MAKEAAGGGAGTLLKKGDVAVDLDYLGKLTPHPIHDPKTPFWKPLSPSYYADLEINPFQSYRMVEETFKHEMKHVEDIMKFPQLTRVLVKEGPFYGGAGFTRYFFEHRAYRADGSWQNPLTPFRSFDRESKIDFAADLVITATGGGPRLLALRRRQ